jgi:hypothetical protein
MMATGSSLRRGILLAGAFGGMLVAGAAAQQSPDPGSSPPAAPAAQPALPPGSPLIGRPETNAAAAKLAPVAPLPIPTAEDNLPIAKLRPPSGFNIEVYAAGLANARTMRQGDKGTIFVSTRLQDKIYAIVDKNGKRDVKVVAKGTVSATRYRVPQRNTLHRRAVADLQNRECRGQP